MGTDDLWEQLRLDEVEHDELAAIVQAHFGVAASEDYLEVVHYHHNESKPALTLRYDDETLKIVSLEGGPGLLEADLATIGALIERDVLAEKPYAIGRRVVFAGVPVTGWVRYGDAFQLVPVPLAAPRPQMWTAANPLLLEARYRPSENFQISIARRARAENAAELLCVALIPLFNGTPAAQHDAQWVLDPDTVTSSQRQQGFFWPGMELMGADFSTIDGMQPMAPLEHDAYYARRGRAPGQVLDIADSFGHLLDSFYAHDDKAQERFLRAAFWLRHAHRSFAASQSATFTALVSAVEALLPPSKAGPDCAVCKKPTGPSGAARFAEFVDRYAPSPTVTNAQRKQLYRLRSALSHGGRLLRSDRNAWHTAFTAEHLKQSEDMTSMWTAVRVLLVNWLADTPKP